MIMPTSQDLLPYERVIRSFLGPRGTNLDAQAAVFNLDHTWMDVIATMESVVLRPYRLTHAGFVVLMTIWITGPRETRELAAVLRVTRGAIVGSVNTLEKRGLVRRIRSTADRRLVSIELTRSGRDLVKRVQRNWHTLEAEITGELSVQDQRTLARLLRKMGARARALRSERDGHIEALNPELFLLRTRNLPAKLSSATSRGVS
jgi:MarR family transcriptional regulator, organic hydroperoxide resistance regulator